VLAVKRIKARYIEKYIGRNREPLLIENVKAEHVMQQIFYLTIHWTQNIQYSKPFQTSFEIRQGSQSSQ
jgi:hypothetical protein